MRLKINADDKVIELRENISKFLLFKEDFELFKVALENITDDRKKIDEREEGERKQLLEEKHLADERAFEMEKLKLSSSNHDSILTASSKHSESTLLHVDLKKFYCFLILKRIT